MHEMLSLFSIGNLNGFININAFIDIDAFISIDDVLFTSIDVFINMKSSQLLKTYYYY